MFFISNRINLQASFASKTDQDDIIQQEFIVQENSETQDNNNNSIADEEQWVIEIPEIELHATISEGTTKEVMNQYVGHFEETSKKEGNIGLAAHNRGYPVNYFQDLKKLKSGSKIFYKCEEYEKTYLVETIQIIKNTDWSYLENTEDNRITLITCVENEPEYRRCIQGIEIEEGDEEYN
jgi:LPXTG-site transpeptidase (sortase) family protein